MRYLLFSICLICLIVFISCDGKDTNPAGSDMGSDLENERIPHVILISANPYKISVLDSTRMIRIGCTVFDSSGIALGKGIQVHFSTRMNLLDAIRLTNVYGKAYAYFYPGRQACLDIVTARCYTPMDTVESHCTYVTEPGPPASIKLACNPDTIMASDKEGVHTCDIRVDVDDLYGNFVHLSMVVLDITDEPPAPDGCWFENGEQQIIKLTSYGIVNTQLNSGTATGRKTIRAYTWPDSINFPNQIIESISDSLIVW